MTKTTTDFREKIGTILVKWHMPTRQAAISEIASAVSELVKECIGNKELLAICLKEGCNVKHNKIKGKARNELRAEIRQRFKERGIEVK